MNQLRIRHADTAQSVGVEGEDFFGRTPATVQRLPGLTLGAKAIYGVITRLMSEKRQPTILEATMKEIARESGGITERHARQLVAELESHGLVVRERILTKPGAPQGIRPLVNLRRGRGKNEDCTRNPSSDCNRNPSSGGAEPQFRSPGTPVPPFLREWKRKRKS